MGVAAPQPEVAFESRASPGASYALSALSTLLAAAAHAFLQHWLASPYLLFYPGVILSAVLGGFGPGLLATALATALVLLRPGLPPATTTPRDVVSAVVFALLCVSLDLLAVRFRSLARRYAELRAERTVAAAEAATRAAQERLARHVTNTPLAEIEWDAEFRVAALNPRTEALFGWSEAELLGKRIDEVPWIPEEDWPGVRALMEAMRKGERPANLHANRNLCRDGRPILCQWYNSALYEDDGRLLSVLSLVLDVTSRELAERALRERSTQLALFIEHAPVAIAMFDRDMRYLAASHRYLSENGLDEGVVGRSHYEVFPELPGRWREIHRRCLAGAVERHDGEPFVRPDGSTDWVRWEIRPWRDDAGGIGGIVLFSEDVTAWRELARRAALADRLAAVGTLVRGLTHEVNSPLAAVGTNVRHALEELRHAPPGVARAWAAASPAGLPEVLSALADATEGAERIKTIVQDLSATVAQSARSPAGCSLEPACQKALARASGHLAACAEVTVDLPARPLVAIAEEDLVTVVANLLANAGQATGTAPNRVRVSATLVDASHLSLAVADTGAGMDEQALARLSEPFFTTRAAGRGRGLGIARCRAIVEGVGGSLTFHSRVGSGTSATVMLPVASGEGGASGRAAAPGEAPAPGR